jgi:epoxyqueuosine reductase QueG
LGAVSEAEKLAAEVKEDALKLGASLVGIVSAHAIDAFPTIWVGWTIQEHTKKTSEAMPDAKSVVVMGYHVWDDMLELAIRKGDGWVYPGYLPLDVLTLAISHHLQKKGYKTAYARSVSHKRLAQLAGFGNYGKNSLIVNPEFGPWIRLAAVLTNAEMKADKPFEGDLCGGCEECVRACPVGALTPYKVDDRKCMLGAHLMDKSSYDYRKEWSKYEPSSTKNSHLMCMECQKACRYGKSRR